MITYKKRYYPTNLNKDEIVLDIETTGLDATVDNLVLLGLVAYENDICYIYQYFAEDNDEEKRLLEIYLSHIEDKKIINFNGDKFDIPFLNVRLDKLGLDPVFPESTDILKLISAHRKYFAFESLKLSDLEKHIGINREDPSRYKVISKLTDEIIKRENPWPIMVHNKNDLIATERLANASSYFEDKLSLEYSDNKLTLKSVWINNDIAQIILQSKNDLGEAYFQGANYEFKVSGNDIEINLHVLYGRFDSDNVGHVAINNFKIANKTEVDIDDNLLVIKENRLYNYINILNLAQKIIENHL